MSNLVPEKRTNRLGHLVTRWVKGDVDTSNRKSVLGTIIPTIPTATTSYIQDTTESDKAQRTELLRKMRREFQNDFDNQPELKGKPGATRNEAIFRMQNRLESAMKTMAAMETSTLQVLSEAPCSRYALMRMVNMMASQVNDSELEFRERVHYMVLSDSGDSGLHNSERVAAVRNALDVDDLSEYPRGSTEHEVVTAALYLLHDHWARRSSQGRSSSPNGVDDAYIRKLLGFLMERPDKADAIQHFVKERNVDLDGVDLELLAEYLNTSAPALGDGLL